MGVQALRQVVPLVKKDSIVFSTPASGAVVAPAANNIAVVTMLAAADAHRHLEVQNRVLECIQHLREKNFFDGTAADLLVRVPLDGTKAGIVNSGTFNTIVTGDVAITIDAALRNPGAKNWVVNAFKQILDHMNEQERLTS